MTLSSLALFRNPVFERECLTFCATRRWFVIRTGLIGGLTLAVFLFFLHAAGQIAAGRYDVVGRTLFSAACLAQVAAVFFLTPALVADLISRERRTGNLDVLLATPLSTTGVLLGKYLSRVSLLLLLVLASFPVVAATLIFGGVRSGQVEGLLLTTTGMVLLLSGPAILVSAFTRQAATAATIAYLVALLPIGLPHLVPAAALGSVDWLAIALDLAQGLETAGRPAALLGVGALVSAVCLLAAWLRLRYERRGNGLPGSAFLAARRVRRGRAFDRRNPIVPRETRALRGGAARGPFWIVLTLIAATYLLVLTLGGAPGPEIHALLATMVSFAVLLLAVLAGSTSVIADRERGLLDALRLTALTPRDVVAGKTLGTFRAVLPLALIPPIHVLLASPLGPGSVFASGVLLGELSLLLLLAAVIGVHYSIQTRTVPRAVLMSLWVFSWLTVAYPLLRVLFTLLMTGKVTDALESPRFSFTVLFPIYQAGLAAVGGDLSPLVSFSHLFYVTLLLTFAPVAFLLFRARYARDDDRAGDSWHDSWKRLARQWEETT